jgi:phenylacetate-CoA ligase
MVRSSSIFTLRSLVSGHGVGRPEMEAFRDARLRELVHHAWNRVPYYRRRFEQHGLKPQDIRGVADLAAIPMTTKKTLQALPAEELTARGVDFAGLVEHRTSGSTGLPFTVRRTWLEERVLNAFRWRAMRYLGWRPADRKVYLGISQPVDRRNDRLPQRLLHRLGVRPFLMIDCHQPVEAIVRQICQASPDVLSGIAGALWRVALTVSEADRRMIRPRFICTGGEVLSPGMRRQITQALAAPVYDVYGSHEFNLVAWECRETGAYHTCDDLLIVEVLADGRPVASGERGELVATSLHSFAMPFIRFGLGDIVTKGAERCVCGQPFSTIGAIQGRMHDHFLLPDGRLIYPSELLVILVRDARWVGEYRLLQESMDKIVLRVVPLAAPSAGELAHLRDRLSDRVGPGVHCDVELVTEFPVDPSGKTRLSRSRVNPIYDEMDWSTVR